MLSSVSSSTISTRALALLLALFLTCMGHHRSFHAGMRLPARRPASGCGGKWHCKYPTRRRPGRSRRPYGSVAYCPLNYSQMLGKESDVLRDGRQERAARTRKLLIEAYLEVAREKQ